MFQSVRTVQKFNSFPLETNCKLIFNPLLWDNFSHNLSLIEYGFKRKSYEGPVMK